MTTYSTNQTRLRDLLSALGVVLDGGGGGTASDYPITQYVIQDNNGGALLDPLSYNNRPLVLSFDYSIEKPDVLFIYVANTQPVTAGITQIVLDNLQQIDKILVVNVIILNIGNDPDIANNFTLEAFGNSYTWTPNLLGAPIIVEQFIFDNTQLLSRSQDQNLYDAIAAVNLRIDNLPVAQDWTQLIIDSMNNAINVSIAYTDQQINNLILENGQFLNNLPTLNIGVGEVITNNPTNNATNATSYVGQCYYYELEPTNNYILNISFENCKGSINATVGGINGLFPSKSELSLKYISPVVLNNTALSDNYIFVTLNIEIKQKIDSASSSATAPYYYKSFNLYLLDSRWDVINHLQNPTINTKPYVYTENSPSVISLNQSWIVTRTFAINNQGVILINDSNKITYDRNLVNYSSSSTYVPWDIAAFNTSDYGAISTLWNSGRGYFYTVIGSVFPTSIELNLDWINHSGIDTNPTVQSAAIVYLNRQFLGNKYIPVSLIVNYRLAAKTSRKALYTVYLGIGFVTSAELVPSIVPSTTTITIPITTIDNTNSSTTVRQEGTFSTTIYVNQNGYYTNLNQIPAGSEVATVGKSSVIYNVTAVTPQTINIQITAEKVYVFNFSNTTAQVVNIDFNTLLLTDRTYGLDLIFNTNNNLVTVNLLNNGTLVQTLSPLSSGNSTAIGNININELSVLYAAGGGGGSNPFPLEQLTDVTIANVENRDLLTFNTATLEWINSDIKEVQTSSTIVNGLEIDDMKDVDLFFEKPTLENADIFTWGAFAPNGGKWVVDTINEININSNDPVTFHKLPDVLGSQFQGGYLELPDNGYFATNVTGNNIGNRPLTQTKYLNDSNVISNQIIFYCGLNPPVLAPLSQQIQPVNQSIWIDSISFTNIQFIVDLSSVNLQPPLSTIEGTMTNSVDITLYIGINQGVNFLPQTFTVQNERRFVIFPEQYLVLSLRLSNQGFNNNSIDNFTSYYSRVEYLGFKYIPAVQITTTNPTSITFSSVDNYMYNLVNDYNAKADQTSYHAMYQRLPVFNRDTIISQPKFYDVYNVKKYTLTGYGDQAMVFVEDPTTKDIFINSNTWSISYPYNAALENQIKTALPANTYLPLFCSITPLPLYNEFGESNDIAKQNMSARLNHFVYGDDSSNPKGILSPNFVNAIGSFYMILVDNANNYYRTEYDGTTINLVMLTGGVLANLQNGVRSFEYFLTNINYLSSPQPYSYNANENSVLAANNTLRVGNTQTFDVKKLAPPMFIQGALQFGITGNTLNSINVVWFTEILPNIPNLNLPANVGFPETIFANNMNNYSGVLQNVVTMFRTGVVPAYTSASYSSTNIPMNNYFKV